MKIRKQISKRILPVLLLVLLASCAKYHSKPLPKINGQKQNIEGITVHKKILNEKESREIFGKSASQKLSQKGYKPILLSIKNKTDQNYSIYSDDMNIQIEEPSQVAKNLHRNTSLRVAAWCAGGLFFWPLFIGAAVDGIKSKDYNKDLNHDFDLKAIYPHEEIKIKSKSKINKLMFVNKNVDLYQLNLKLVDKNNPNQKRNFTV
ncbi:MAG: hypothetical protein ABIA74_03450 [bacterium]